MVSSGYISRSFCRSLLMPIKTVCPISSCVTPLEVGGCKVNTSTLKSLRTHRFHLKYKSFLCTAIFAQVKKAFKISYNIVFLFVVIIIIYCLFILFLQNTYDSCRKSWADPRSHLLYSEWWEHVSGWSRPCTGT